MAIQITAHGSREGVLRHISEYKLEDEKALETSQLEALKAILVSEIAALPTEINGVHLQCQALVTPGQRHITINIVPQKLHL